MSEALKSEMPMEPVARDDDDAPGAASPTRPPGSEPEGVPLVARPGSSRMRWAQGVAVCRAEMARLVVRRGALGAMVLASLPVLMLGAFAFLSSVIRRGVPDAARMFADVFVNLSLAMVLFFGCVAIFSTLIRREVRDKTLHYYFLAPVRREVVLLGKYAGGVLTAWLVFGLSTLLSYCLAFVPYLWRAPVELQAYFSDGPGLAHLGTYLAVTALAAVGYGAVFLFMGMFFKNPIFPAMAVYFWEIGNFLLPPALKKVSIIYYLAGLLPLPRHDGPFALLSEVPPAWLAVPGVLIVSAILVALAAWKARRMEILYGED